MKKLKKLFYLFMAMWLSLASLGEAKASNVNESILDTISDFSSRIALATDSTWVNAASACYYSELNFTHSGSCPLVLINSGGRTMYQYAYFSGSTYGRTLQTFTTASSVTSNGYMGLYFTGAANCTFTALKVPERTAASKTLYCTVPEYQL